MSDERLREAERRWRETGSVEDEARYLLERVRVGDLTRERLELAAYCGHEGAGLASGSERTRAGDLMGFLIGFPGEPYRATGVSAAWIAQAASQTVDLSPEQRAAVDAGIAAARAWATCPCSEHAEECRRAELRIRGALHAVPEPVEQAMAAMVLAREAALVAGAANGDTRAVMHYPDQGPRRIAHARGREALEWVAKALVAQAPRTGLVLARLLESVAQAVARWALR